MDFTADAAGIITDGIFRGLSIAAAQRIQREVARLRGARWPEREVIVIRDNAIRAARIAA
jgi:hypothetical protein